MVCRPRQAVASDSELLQQMTALAYYCRTPPAGLYAGSRRPQSMNSDALPDTKQVTREEAEAHAEALFIMLYF